MRNEMMSPTANPDTHRLRAVTSKDGAVLFDLEHDRLLKLNSVAAEMWRQLSAGSTESEVIENIAEQYGVDKQRVAADLRALLVKIAALAVNLYHAKFAPPEQASLEPSLDSSHFRSAPETEEHEAEPTAWLMLCAISGLAMFDLTLSVTSLRSLCHVVQSWPLKRSSSKENPSVIGQVCRAVEQGCVWYPKKALCLQRSAVTTCLLRNRGVAARLVIGARPMPFLAHAWVQVEDSVVNDSSTVKHFYQLLASY
jgi:hypothetical protein